MLNCDENGGLNTNINFWWVFLLLTLIFCYQHLALTVHPIGTHILLVALWKARLQHDVWQPVRSTFYLYLANTIYITTIISLGYAKMSNFGTNYFYLGEGTYVKVENYCSPTCFILCFFNLSKFSAALFHQTLSTKLHIIAKDV